MNRWAIFLADAPVLHQRLIARTQRISLPRSCPADERIRRLRHALCHQRTVQRTYFAHDTATQYAIQHLATLPRGITPHDLTAHYGHVRPWHHIWRDPTPHSIAETLLLLGWLFLRPPTGGSAARYIVPEPLRQWLPTPLHIPTIAPVPAIPVVPVAVRITTTLLLASVDHRCLITHTHTLAQDTLRLLTPRLAPIHPDILPACATTLLPILLRMHLIANQQGRAELTLAGQRWLAAPIPQQQQHLLHAWTTFPTPDPWLTAMRVPVRGMNLPLFRRRLLAWVAHLPHHHIIDPQPLYTTLEAALGPLADADTHGYRTTRRRPWQPATAAAVFTAALHGPLTWLGIVAPYNHATHTLVPDARHTPDTLIARIAHEHTILPADLPAEATDDVATHPCDDATNPAPAAPAATDTSPPRCLDAVESPHHDAWTYGPPGNIIITHTSRPSDTLHLLPFVTWAAADATTTTYRITPQRITHAIRRGYSDTALRTLLEQHAGPLPPDWHDTLQAMPPTGTLHLIHGTIVVADHPEILNRAARARSVQRTLAQRLAPGIALVAPDQVAAITRVLARQRIVVHETGTPPPTSPSAPPRTDPDSRPLTPSECSTLLLACACYRQHAPPNAPLILSDTLEERLWAALPPALNAATTAAIQAMAPPASPSAPLIDTAPAENTSAVCTDHEDSKSLPVTLDTLRTAIARRDVLTITYTDAHNQHSRRTIRPLMLESHGDLWYLHAYCTTRHSERHFRLDRITAIQTTECLRAGTPNHLKQPDN